MTVRFYNTLTRSLEEFKPLEKNKVKLYTCGPTVYNFAHIGNFRAYVFEDLLKRFLKYSGYDVTHIMNLTDVDDKTIIGCQREHLALKAYTKKYVDAFFEDIDALNIERADKYPAATDHIPEMIALIQALLDKGYAYTSDDGCVYYSIDKFGPYGCLAHLDKSGMRAGARVAQDEYEKENVADFALWKAWTEKDGDVAWDSPWGRGRPGWHIECSAMSMKYLGESFDLHTGGVDNIFPHHDDEIAQSEAATGKKFVNYWLHCAHLVVEGKKMSKSLGNFFTLRDLQQKGYSGREIRYQLIATHYRQSLNFTMEGLDGMKTALARLDEFQTRLADVAGSSKSGSLPAWAAEAQKQFDDALSDDLNISTALGALFDLVRAANKAIDGKQLKANEAKALQDLLEGFDSVLGFLKPTAATADATVLDLVQQREAARKSKNWAESDRLRTLIANHGWIVQDTAQGPKLKKL